MIDFYRYCVDIFYRYFVDVFTGMEYCVNNLPVLCQYFTGNFVDVFIGTVSIFYR